MTTPSGLAFLRNCAGISQARMAELMGLPLRTYEDIEAGRSQFRPVHRAAGEMALLRVAIEKGDLDVLPMGLRALAAKLSNLFVLGIEDAETDEDD